jgi:hypothetical protein
MTAPAGQSGPSRPALRRGGAGDPVTSTWQARARYWANPPAWRPPRRHDQESKLPPVIVLYITVTAVTVALLWVATGTVLLITAGARYHRRTSPAGVFPDRLRAAVARKATEAACVATVRKRVAPCTWAWYQAEATPGGEVITTSGWAVTSRGIDRIQHRAASHLRQRTTT